MGLKDLFSTDTDSALPPENRLDEAIRELGKYYVAEGRNRIASPPAEEESGGIGAAIAQAFGGGSEEEKAIEPLEDLEMLQKIRSMLLDKSAGAKHAIHILNDETLLATPDSEKYFQILFEPTLGATKLNKTTADADAGALSPGMMSQCGLAKLPPSSDSKTPESQTVEIILPDHGNDSEEPDALKSPHLSAIMVTHPLIHPAQSRNIAGSIFFNSIPGIEMSQCSPFIRLKFESDFEVASGMTLHGFAGGNIGNAKAPTAEAEGINFENFRIEPETTSLGDSVEGGLSGIVGPLAAAAGIDSGQSFEIKNDRTYSAGIELFQAPQSLNSFGGATSSARSGKEGNGLFSTSTPTAHRQLNPAAPIATLLSLNISIAGLGLSTLANKTASLDFIIHDRSFMRFLAPLIGGSNFQGTSITVEYGWMHPQATETSEGNAYANFLNSLRSKSTFNIQVANTSLGNDGQVKVSLKLASRGVSDLVSVPAGSGVTHIPAVALSPLFTRITSQIKKAATEEVVQIGDEDRLSNIEQGYTAMASFTGPTDLIPIKQYKELLAAIKESSGTDQASQQKVLQAAVQQINLILGERADSVETTQFNTLKLGLKSKRQRIQQVDIFSEGDGKLTPLSQQVGEKEKGEGGESESQSSSESATVNVGSKYPTLGSVIASYVGRPMQAIGKYDEVQMLFYPFNTQAGAMHDFNIASFTLDGFEQFITDVALKNPSISCKSFVESLFGSEYAGGPGNPAHVNYGLSTYYKDLNAQLEEASDEDKKKILAGNATGAAKERALNSIYSNPKKEPIFVPPDVTFFMESVPSTKPDPEDEKAPPIDTTILRLHIYDAKAGIKNSTLLLNQLNVAPITTSAAPSENTSVPDSAKNCREFADADQSGIDDSEIGIQQKDLGTDEAGNVQTLLFTGMKMTELKNALKSVHPSITFGTQFTNVKSVNANSNTAGAVNQVLLVNAVKESRDATSSQPSSELEDIFIIPASISMQTEGFPLVEYAQKYFIDFGTGTTMDNFYYVTGLSHAITPGSFTTNIQFSYNGSATRRAIISELERAVKAGS